MLVFEKQKQRAFHPSAPRILRTKALSSGHFDNPAYTPRGETTCRSAGILGTQTCSQGFGDMLILDHVIKPHLCAFSAQSCSLSRPISHKACRKSPFGGIAFSRLFAADFVHSSRYRLEHQQFVVIIARDCSAYTANSSCMLIVALPTVATCAL